MLARAAAVVMLLGGLGLLSVDLAGLKGAPAAAGEVPPWMAMVLRDLLPALGLAVLLLTGAAILNRPTSSGQLPSELGPVETHRLTDAIDDVRVSVANLTLALKTRPGVGAPVSPGSPAASSSSLDTSQALQRIIELFEEIRQLTLLDEKGRAARLADQRQQQKAATLAEAGILVEARQWARADSLLQSLETSLGGDAEIATARQELADRRGSTENDAITRARASVEDLMAIGRWDQAVQTARDLVGNFPDNPDALAVSARVARERELAEENAAQRIYEEVKQSTERRQWQKALAAAHQLLERFPGHRRAEKVREQLGTIQANADIERRQDMESKIQELIRSRRFVEAVAMAEQMLEQFPSSPQADSLEEMLPKMRAMAIEQELDAEVS